MDKLKKIFRRPQLILIYVIRAFSKLFTDKLYLQILFFLNTGKKLKIKNPKTYNEKIQWLKLNDRNPIYTQLVDKISVKEIVGKKIGLGHIIKTLGVWDSFDEIDFKTLPDKFVLKATHDSGTVVVCKNKSNLKINKVKRKIERSLKRNYYWIWREWPYKNVKPRIIAEEYLEDESNYELKDYKIFCFNGKAKYIQVDFDRFIKHKRNIYDIDWNLLDFQILYPSDRTRQIERPSQLEEMIKIAEKLSKGLIHMRVDLYSIKDKIYFGELTFHHESGFGNFNPKEWDYKLGDLIKLPVNKTKNQFS